MSENAAKRSWHRLRPLEHGDVPVVAEWFRSTHDLAMFASRMPLPPSAAALERSWSTAVDSMDPQTGTFFVVEDLAGRLVSFAGVEDVNLVHGTAITPLFVAAPARQSAIGLVTRALVLDLAFQALGLHRVVSMHRADNTASRRINEACGLQPEGTMREAWRDGQRRVDVSVFGILALEWFGHREQLARSMPAQPTLRLGDDPRSEWPTSLLG